FAESPFDAVLASDEVVGLVHRQFHRRATVAPEGLVPPTTMRPSGAMATACRNVLPPICSTLVPGSVSFGAKEVSTVPSGWNRVTMLRNPLACVPPEPTATILPSAVRAAAQ